MCVVALAWRAHPRWCLVLAGNRDEYHDRPSAPLARTGEVIGGRDLRSGGMWLGVSEAGRFAVVTNVAGYGLPDPGKASRGALVAGYLETGAPLQCGDAYNPFTLVAGDGNALLRLTNRPSLCRVPLLPGVHSVSNGVGDAPWPRREALEAGVRGWLDAGQDDPDALFALLGDERPPAGPDHPPVFIRAPAYGTRASTLILIDAAGNGRIIERRFGPGGVAQGESGIEFRWPDGES